MVRNTIVSSTVSPMQINTSSLQKLGLLVNSGPFHFKNENNEIVVLLSGNPDEVDKIIRLVIFLYKEMLTMFLRVFKNPLIKKLKNF